MLRTLVLLLLTGLLGFRSASASREEKHTLTLRFIPQAATGSDSPTLPAGIATHPLRVTFVDGRPPAEAASVGTGTDDDDQTFPWTTSSPVLAHARAVFDRTVIGWGVGLEEGAELSLEIRLTRFFVTEKDQAVGSSYTGEVNASYILKDSTGSVLADGSASGDARRYGRKRSEENCNEVLSDALKEAYANLLNLPGLHDAWTGQRKSPEATAAAITPESLLAELLALKEKGFSVELLVQYVANQILTAPLSARDIMAWGGAGVPEPVITEAMKRYSAPREE